MTGALIEVAHAERVFRMRDGLTVRAIRDVTVTFPASSVTALTGPSGSGKSTLLQSIGGIDRLDSGSVLIDGCLDLGKLDGTGLTEYRRTVGFVFQRFNLLPSLSALDNVLVPLVPKRKLPFNREMRGRELLGLVGLQGREDSIPSRLSGGQQQRVAIARALIAGPRILLADEPTGNLDTTTGMEILDLLLGLRESHGTTVVLATHDSTIAHRCDKVLHLVDGALVTQRRHAVGDFIDG
jgi:putative ABC transport system ATP-binding protein